MEDTSFIHLAKEENLSKIDIDPRLIESFKRVLYKIQAYFNAYGYTSQRNYQAYFEQFLLTDSEKKIRIYVNKIEPISIGGFYNRQKHEICINEDQLKRNPETLDATLCHEFIHFLVMHNLNETNSDPEIRNGGFINEALTELLTQQMYPKSNAYDAQVSMHTYANLLSGKTNNFSKFLQGVVDARWSSPEWKNYREKTTLFQKDFNKAGYINLMQAQTNVNFIEAQRSLIALFIKPNTPKTIEEYIDSIKKLMSRPVADTAYISKVIETLDKALLKTLNLKDSHLERFLLQKLAEIRNELSKSNQYERRYHGTAVYEFEFAGRKFALDEKSNLYGNAINITRSWNPKEQRLTLNFKGEWLTLNVAEIDFHQTEIQTVNRIKERTQYFNKDIRKNLAFVSQASKGPSPLIKLEKFTFPILSSFPKQKSSSIYVATYQDRIVLLNNESQIGEIRDMDLKRYIGMSSTNPKTAAIFADKIGMIEKGMVYSILSEKGIEKSALIAFTNQICDALTFEQRKAQIDAYKKKEDCFGVSEEDIEYFALSEFALEKFQEISEEKKKHLYERVKKQNPQFVISTKEGKIDVSYIFGDAYQSAFKSKREVLYDSENRGMYNEVYESISKQNFGEDLPKFFSSLPIDKMGNIIYSDKETEKTSNMTKEIAAPKAILAQVERLLKIRITNIAGYTDLKNTKAPLAIAKGQETVRQEQQQILQKLDECYYLGNIDYNTWQEMKKTIHYTYGKWLKDTSNLNFATVSPEIFPATSKEDMISKR